MNTLNHSHPLYVKPETVASMIPRHLRYALNKEEVESLIRKGAIGYREDAKPPDRISPNWRTLFRKMN